MGHKTLKLWNVEDGNAIRTFEDNNEIRTFRGHISSAPCVAKQTDTTSVSGSYDQTLKLWNVEDGNVICTFEGHTDAVRCVGDDILDRVTCVAKLTDTIFVSGSYPETMKLWNVDDGLIRYF